MRVGRKVAVKVLRAALAGETPVAKRFVREAEIISQLEHPNCLKLFDFGWTPDGRPYLVTELLKGETLAHRLSRGRLSLGEAARTAQSVLRALEEAHEKGIVHRDLKPSNIFLQDGKDTPRVRVLDFGIARLTNSSTLTEPGMIMGTPAYMSPEQSLKDSVDGRSDLYSVGAILFECLTGRAPFIAQNAQTLILKHALMQAPRLNQVSSGIPGAVETLVSRLLEKAVEDRPQTCAEVVAALEPYVHSTAVAPAPVSETQLEAAFAPGVMTPVDLEIPSELEDRPRPLFFNPASWIAAIGLVFLALAIVTVMGRMFLPGRVDVAEAVAPPPPEPVMPAIPAPLLEPPGEPAPLMFETEEVSSPEAGEVVPATPVAPRRIGAPPGYVDVEL
ncbi:MAG: serine/threonine-protein kinase [Myxococcota bacterium]